MMCIGSGRQLSKDQIDRMDEEAAQFIVGDAAVSALEQGRAKKRRWFRRRKTSAPPPLPFTHCENCGTPLTGHYCAQCGQPAVDYRRSFGHVLRDVLDSFLNWDSKFFATIGLLLTRPWRLTNQFVTGRRVSYLHPLRLYLLVSILFFLAAKFGASQLHIDIPNESKPAANLPPEAQAKLDDAMAKLPGKESKSLLRFDTDSPPTDPFGRWLDARAKEKLGEHGTKAGLFVVTLASNLPYMMMCAIPLFAFVLKVLYLRRHIFYIDHLVYALHIHTFTYLAIVLISLAGIAMQHWEPQRTVLVCWLLALIALAQILFSIRRVYGQGWFKTIVKFLLGGLAYVFVLAVALAGTFFATLAIP